MRIGSRVKCIDDTILAGQEEFVASAYQNWVKQDEEYIIRDIFENNGIVDGVVLENLYNKPIYQSLICAIQEPAFRSNRFVELLEPLEESEEELHKEVMLEIVEQIAKLTESL